MLPVAEARPPLVMLRYVMCFWLCRACCTEIGLNAERCLPIIRQAKTTRVGHPLNVIHQEEPRLWAECDVYDCRNCCSIPQDRQFLGDLFFRLLIYA